MMISGLKSISGLAGAVTEIIKNKIKTRKRKFHVLGERFFIF
jgi:hypothetical protein